MNCGRLTSFILYTLFIVFSVSQLSALVGQTLQALASSLRLTAALGRRPKMDHRGGLVTQSINGRLEFVDVHFQFPSRVEAPSLTGVSFSVPEKSVVALVGPANGGKTTVAALIERFYDPQQGRIMLDDKDLCSYDPRWLREHIGIVTQEPPLFAATVARNIGYGKDSAPLSEIVDVARRVHAHDFICGLPDGYQTPIGEGGVRLSGVQRHRIATARALIKDPAIVILAQTTADGDADAEGDMAHSTAELMRGRTCIVITSRLATIKAADQVVVVRHGQVEQQGTHAQLVDTPGYYNQLVARGPAGEDAAQAGRVEETREVEALAANVEARLKAGDTDVLPMVQDLRRRLADLGPLD